MKGSVLDIIPIIAILLAAGIVMIIGWTVLAEFETAINGTDMGADIEPLQNTRAGIEMLDAMWIFVVIGLFSSAMIGAILINTHPAVFVITIFLLTPFLLLTAITSNAYFVIADASVFTEAVNSLPNLYFYHQNSPLIIFFFGVVLVVATFGKLRGGGGQV